MKKITAISIYITIIILFLFGSTITIYPEDREKIWVANADLRWATEILKTLSEKLRRLEKRHIKDITVTATAYCNNPICINVSKWNDGLTATGTVARVGVIAVDTNIIPLGSIVYIDGMGWFRAEDTGGAIKGKHIDIFLGDYKKAKKFGRKKVRIKIYKEA